MKRILVIGYFLFQAGISFGQVDSTTYRYQVALDSLQNLLRDNGSFEKAVFIAENCYLDNRMFYSHFDQYIHQLVDLTRRWQEANPLRDYPFEDSINFQMNAAVFKTLKDTITFVDGQQKKYLFLPFTYDFDDFSGDKNWTNMFVTKLIGTHSGNCHSLPYLYKILADEMGASCWLSLAPNHMYIKNRCKKIGWYNTELTSGCFPIDAWIMASGYLPVKAVQSGIYMDTLSNTAALTLCLVDLAKGYEHKIHDYSDGFILKCCDLALKYYPVNVQALLLKAETMKRIYEREKDEKHIDDKALFGKMEQLYGQLYDLGYREMPENMYKAWLESVMKEKDKYTNKSVQQQKS